MSETSKVIVEFTVPRRSDAVEYVRKALYGEWEGPDGEPWGMRVLDTPDAGDVEETRVGLPVHAVRGAMTDGAVMDAHGRMLMPGEIVDLIERLHAALSKSESEALKVSAELDESAAREAVLRGALEQAMRLLNTIGVDHELYEYRQLDAALATPASPAAERAMTVIEAAVIEAACELTDGIRKRSAGFTVNADRLMERVDALRSLDGKEGASDA